MKRHISLTIVGAGYFIFALLFAANGLRYLPVILTAPHDSGFTDIIPSIMIIVLGLGFGLFFALVGYSILSMKWRKFYIIGSSVSILMIPFGTILVILSLVWIRQHWID